MLSVLAVEIDGLTLRAAVVRRGLKGLAVSDCATVERAEDNELLTAAELSMLVSRIVNCPKNAVLVSPLVTVIEVSMDKKKVRRMKPRQLKEALRWEAEPYMTVPAAESLVGYEPGQGDGKGQTGFWVSILAQEDYRSLKEAFAAGGLKLRRAYPPEVCFPVAAMQAGKGEDQAVIEVGRQAMRGALIEGGRISTYRTSPAAYAAIRAYLDGRPATGVEPMFNEAFGAWRLAGRQFTLTGPGGSDAAVVGFFRQALRLNAVALAAQAGGAASPVYASVSGAGLRELRVSGGWKRAGVDDSVELGLLIRQRAPILPVVTMLTIGALFFSHYFHLKERLKFINAEVSLLAERKEEYLSLQNQVAALEPQLAALQRKAEFLEGKALDGERLFFLVLSVVERERGVDGLTLLRAEYLPGDQVLLEGQASSPAGVSLLALALQEGEWCKHVVMESVSQVKSRKSISENQLNEQGELEEVTREEEQTVYNFRLRAALVRGADLGRPDLRP